jgi:hypothetical protein
VAETLATAGWGYFGWNDEDLGDLPKGQRKALLASLIQRETTVPLDWTSARLRMGVRAVACRSIKRKTNRMKEPPHNSQFTPHYPRLNRDNLNRELALRFFFFWRLFDFLDKKSTSRVIS